MDDRFLVLRGTDDGPVFLARPDQPDDADTWTADRDAARRFDDRDDAEATQAGIVVRQGVAVAVVPDYIRHAMTARHGRDVRHGSGPDRPQVHGTR